MDDGTAVERYNSEGLVIVAIAFSGQRFLFLVGQSAVRIGTVANPPSLSLLVLSIESLTFNCCVSLFASKEIRFIKKYAFH